MLISEFDDLTYTLKKMLEERSKLLEFVKSIADGEFGSMATYKAEDLLKEIGEL